jgi:AAA domain
VYLTDVSIDNCASDIAAKDKLEPAFQKSEWFTRGWTLQELIAPKVVEFFSMEGTKLGDKKSLERQIYQITGIAIEALEGKPLSQFDVKERLSWTTRRQTTVDEDAVYCLLGIFDIHMPLIYAEGQQKALARLQREIQISSNPDSFVATDAPWIVPFERNPRFTGCETQLAELEGKLFTNDHTSKIAITGLGGVGKTQLVLELLYRTKEKHKDCSIIWIPATSIESLHQGYLAVAEQLDIPGCKDEKTDVKKLVQDHLSKEDAGQWLLVFDNADDIDVWMAAAPT